MFTSFSNIIDPTKHEARGCEDDPETKVHGITCSQAFHRVYSNLQFQEENPLGTVNSLMRPTAAAAFLSN